MAQRTNSNHGGSPTIALLIGLTCMGFAIWIFTLTGPYGDGVIVNGRVLASEQAGERRLVFHQSDVEFVDEEAGRTWVITSEVGSVLAPDPGDVRRVSYRPNDPAGGRVLEGRIYVWIFGGMALLFLGPSIHVLVARARSDDTVRRAARAPATRSSA